MSMPQVIPRNVEAEQVLLGTILTDNQAYESVADFLEPAHFFDEFHQRLFELIQTARRTNQMVAADTIAGQLGIPLDQIVCQEQTLDNSHKWTQFKP